ncbi:MAG: HAD family hydrolase [Myxococcota bacterium]|nr:HAD family hydrolase [Myxococcota bacterium]
MFRALLLDLDDTLFDRGAAFRAWAQAAARAQLGRSLEPAELATLVALDGRGHRPRADFAADAGRQLGLAIDPESCGVVLAEHVVPEPGVRELLVTLGATHHLAIVTNGSGASQRTKLARLGLDTAVHAVFVSGELGIAKPASGIFERALRWTEHAARDVLFVGDEPVIDLAPAAALGMATAWRARTAWPSELAPPTYRLAAIGELAGVCA